MDSEHDFDDASVLVDDQGQVDEQQEQTDEEAGLNESSEGGANDDDTKSALTDDELDKIADTAIETLRSILSYFDAGDAEIEEYEGEEGELILDAVGANLAVLIGRYGKSLDALQFIVTAIVNKKIGFRYPIVIDIEGYRHRRRQKLESMAKSAAARCIRSRSDVRMRPMTPYERRIIHIILRNERRVFTESEGEEPNRLIVVRPAV
jgi:spoIIIJ-associated protein